MIDFPISNIQILLPELFIAFAAMLVLILAAFSKKFSKLTCIICASIFLIAAMIIIKDLGANSEISDQFFKLDKYVNYSKLILVFSTIVILLLCHNDPKYQKFSYEFPILITFSTIGMMLMISSNDFVSMYLGLELQSLCLYALTAFDRDKSNSTEAGIKYFVLGAIASGILLFGISLIYGSTGLTNFTEITKYFSNSNIVFSLLTLVGLVMLIIAIGFKISAAPFHIWTPDVYQGAPLIITAFMSTVSKFAAVFLMLKILFEIFGSLGSNEYEIVGSLWMNQWSQIIIMMSALSMLVGAIGALKQESIKRVLAYSSIGHIGYVLMGISSANDSVIGYILTYLVIYIVINIGVFSFLLNVSEDNDLSINSFKGLSKYCPVSSACLAVLLLSLAGIPPMAGFFTKFFIFKIAIEQNLYGLCAVALISSVLSAFYYLKIIKLIYFEEPNDNAKFQTSFTNINMIVFTFASLINLSFFCFINKLNFS